MDDNATEVVEDCLVWSVHDFVFDVWADRRRIDTMEVLTPVGLMIVSLLLCLTGFYAMRAVLAVCAFFSGALLVMRASFLGGGMAMDCDTLSVVTVVFGGVCALLTGLLMKTLSLLIGAASLGGVVGFGTAMVCGEVCLQPLWAGAPVFLSLPLVQFWGATLMAAIAGALVARKHYRELAATVAAIVGGFGVAFSARKMHYEASGGSVMPNAVVMAIVILCAGGGLGVQYAVWTWRRRRRREREAKKEPGP